jgi:hypothetical protein
MYEDLNENATLRFNKEREAIFGRTRAKVREMQNEYAALTGATGAKSGAIAVSSPLLDPHSTPGAFGNRRSATSARAQTPATPQMPETASAPTSSSRQLLHTVVEKRLLGINSPSELIRRARLNIVKLLLALRTYTVRHA